MDNSTTSRNTCLVKKARFRYPASIGEIIYDSRRGVDKQKVLNLATCDYVYKGVSVLIQEQQEPARAGSVLPRDTWPA